MIIHSLTEERRGGMNKRIVILGDDEFLSDDAEEVWELEKLLHSRGVKVEVVLTDNKGMDAGVTAALS
jgi:hypothetical protein